MSKTKWLSDPAHSEIGFKVRHMMITNVTGNFDVFTVEMQSSEADFSDAEMQFEADIASVNTRNAQRDEHVRSADFFNAAVHTKMTFQSTSFKKVVDNEYTLAGILSMCGISRNMSLPVTFTGTVIDPWGQVKAGFEIGGVINRSDFGLKWNTITDEGTIALDEQVKLIVNVQLVKQV